MEPFWLKGIQADWIVRGSFTGTPFLLTCAPVFILILLGFSKTWARITDRPIVFALVYGTPFFLLTFIDSLGDANHVVQMIYHKYWMSEFGATWIHYWMFKFLHAPLNLSAKAVVALSNRLAGLVYLWAVAHASCTLCPEGTPSKRLLYRLAFFSAGITIMFYGYVENSPISLAGEQLWLWTALALFIRPSVKRAATSGLVFALATSLHGRMLFLSPLFALACVMPAGSLLGRFKRLFVGSATYVFLLGGMIAYIYFFDYAGTMGSFIGNAKGGGNGRMFVESQWWFHPSRMYGILRYAFISVGVLLPLSVLFVLFGLVKRGALLLWGCVYVAIDLLYWFFWEFDYGPLVDCDLVVAGAGAFVFLSAFAILCWNIPRIVVVPCVLGSAYVTMSFAMYVNKAPLSWNMAPQVTPVDSSGACVTEGLQLTHFSDQALQNPLGAPSPAVPFVHYGATATAPASKEFGGVYSGYLKVPQPGRYRLYLRTLAMARVSLGTLTVFDDWTAPKGQIVDREVSFPRAGAYPIRVEFFTTVPTAPFQIEIEGPGLEKRPIALEDLCF